MRTKTREPDSAGKGRKSPWGEDLIEPGFTVIPNVLLERYDSLGLEPIDLCIVLHLASYWWFEEKLPHPAKTTLAQACGISPRSVQRRIARLEKAGLITRKTRRIAIGDNDTNVYDLSPLVSKLRPFARDMVAEKKRHAAEREERRRKRVAPALPEEDDGG